MKKRLIKELKQMQNKYRDKEKYEVMNLVIDDVFQIVNKYDSYDYIQDKMSDKIKEIKNKFAHLSRFPDKYEYCMLKIKSKFHNIKENLETLEVMKDETLA